MLFKSLEVVGADVDIHSYHTTRFFGIGRQSRMALFAKINQCLHRSAEHERASVGYPGFNEQVRFYLPYQFLHTDDILNPA